MTIRVSCESCGATMTLADQWAGRKGKCKSCGTVVVVPRLAAPKGSDSTIPTAKREPARHPQQPIPETPAEKPAPERMQHAVTTAFDGQIAKIRTPLTGVSGGYCIWHVCVFG